MEAVVIFSVCGDEGVSSASVFTVISEHASLYFLGESAHCACTVIFILAAPGTRLWVWNLLASFLATPWSLSQAVSGAPCWIPDQSLTAAAGVQPEPWPTGRGDGGAGRPGQCTHGSECQQ